MFGIKKDMNKELIKFSTKGKIDKVKMLIQSGANVNYRNEKGWTATHGASSQGRIEVLELLLSEGAELDAVTNEGMTLLHTVALYSSVAWHDRTNIIAFLLKGMDVNITSPDGLTPLHAAAAGLPGGAEGKHQIAAVGFLIDSGASVSPRDKTGCTPLHVAAARAQSRAKVIRLLIERGADINAQQMDGATPLHFAAQTGDVNNVWELLHKKADRNIKTNDGRTAQQVASLSVIHCF